VCFCSPSEVAEILHLAKLNELEVIPLVQTFGHMEVSGKDGHYLVPGWDGGGAARAPCVG
jgi:hypothetical protein